MRRREFLSAFLGATVIAGLPLPKFVDPYDQFLMSLGERVKHILIRDEATMKRIWIDPIEEIGGEQFRFVRLWVEEREQPLTWLHPY